MLVLSELREWSGVCGGKNRYNVIVNSLQGSFCWEEKNPADAWISQSLATQHGGCLVRSSLFKQAAGCVVAC